MRLLELDISNLRGIKAAKLFPGGENLVIWGPNGSGKSAVVDAVDFLLTGRISRLVGEGTAGITLKEHGPHVDHKPQEASVRAVVRIPGHQDPIVLRRTIASPNKLQYPTEAERALRPVLDAAAKGQHVLSRRQILRFVAAEAGKRAGEVQALLDLNELEDIRKALTKVKNAAKAEEALAVSEVRRAEAATKTTLNLATFDEKLLLAEVNRHRALLHGEPLSVPRAAHLKSGLTPPAGAPQIPALNPETLRRDREDLAALLKSSGEKIREPDAELRRLLRELRGDETALRHIKRLQLLDLGVSLIEEDGSCPLCGTKWGPGELERHLREHMASAKVAAGRKERIDAAASSVAATATACKRFVDRLAAAAVHLGMEPEVRIMQEWSARLDVLVRDLSLPTTKYPGDKYTEEEVGNFVAPHDATEKMAAVLKEAQVRAPGLTPEQQAWDALTGAWENLRRYEESKAKLDQASVLLKRAEAMYSAFEEARDSVLSSLYKAIEARFTEIYRAIHADDETGFEGSLRPEGPGLVLEVEFYGRGKFPPMAVHSEGHQDTMGICLYLALAERLTAGLIDLTILDDVVMSVDAEHRRHICQLLSEKFSGRQFLITTHDRTWAQQLVSRGVAQRKHSVEFSRWSIETGPLVAAEADLWERIETELKAGDVAAAAFRLRRGAEQYFENVCDAMWASVRYRTDGRWELSDFVNGAISAYLKHLRTAKTAAQSWKDDGALEKLEELETVAAQIVKRSQVELWAVNQNVHYNRWGDFRPEDLRPVVEAFRDLFGLLQCAACGSVLFIASGADKDPIALRCRCGKVSWNLVKKGT